ncbi:MAG: plasmid stabilization system protein ParE [Cyclobacteriaceae bacterium]
MKKVQVIWTEEALTDLELIFDFIIVKLANSAENIINSILSRTSQLEGFPQSGSPFKPKIKTNKEYRYLVESYYKLVYSLSDATVFIEAFLDTRQNPESINL